MGHAGLALPLFLWPCTTRASQVASRSLRHPRQALQSSLSGALVAPLVGAPEILPLASHSGTWSLQAGARHHQACHDLKKQQHQVTGVHMPEQGPAQSHQADFGLKVKCSLSELCGRLLMLGIGTSQERATPLFQCRPLWRCPV